MEEKQDHSPTQPKNSAAATVPEATTSAVVLGREETREHHFSPPPGFPAPPLQTAEKRGRGRPPGSGKLQRIASMGGVSAETSMPDFTAYVVTVAPRENVVTKIISIFEEMSPETVTVLSATGQVSTVVIFGFGGTVTYKGNFDILSLCGQCMCTKVSNSEEGKNVMLASSLSAPDGNVFGGVLESAMIAATPVELVIGVFKQTGVHKQSKRANTSRSPKTRRGQDSPWAPSVSGSIPEATPV